MIIATYGDYGTWAPLIRRALDSVNRQTRIPDEVVVHHGQDLACARNGGANLVSTDWLIFLDADDELDERYIEASLAGSGDIRQPSTLGIQGDQVDDYPVLIPEAPLAERNYIVIGAMQWRDKFLQAGGFANYSALEDWELWQRLVLHQKAVVTPCPDAIYRVHVTPTGRNNSVQRHGECYMSIRRRHEDAWAHR